MFLCLRIYTAFMRIGRDSSRIPMRLRADSGQPRTKKGGTAVKTGWLKQRDFARAPLSAWKHRMMGGQQQMRQHSGKLHVLHEQIPQLPPRPDRSVLSDSIPLFFISRNQSGFWVAREADGRSGGLFLLKRSAARFARKKSSPGGCATMFVEQPLELDIPNQGSRLVAPLAAALDLAGRRLPGLVTFLGMVAAEWRKLVAQIARALASERRNREAIEKELFRGEYALVSKSDDDLPVP
jgi:hypothetical protein